MVLLGPIAVAAPFDEDEPTPPPGTAAVPTPLPPLLQVRTEEVASLPLHHRLEQISELFIGKGYQLDPLGEGRHPDTDPLVRYDVFDCLTFVEEVLSLALSGSPKEAGRVRTHLRYGDAPIHYANRRHFMELQWIPGAIAAGWLRDVTAEYGEVQRLHREVTSETWANWRGRSSFALRDEELPTGDMTLAYLPLHQVADIVDRIRPGSILLTVRADRPSTPIWISHVGFIFRGPRGAIIRHATRLKPAGVRDHDLAWYLRHLQSYNHWPAIGIAVLEPIEQGPRRSPTQAH
jgi:hypothetical protein